MMTTHNPNQPYGVRPGALVCKNTVAGLSVEEPTEVHPLVPLLAEPVYEVVGAGVHSGLFYGEAHSLAAALNTAWEVAYGTRPWRVTVGG